MRERASLLGGLVAAGIAVVAVMACSAATAEAAGSVLPTGTAVDLPSSGMSLKTPADGRINGYYFTGRVTGIGFAPHAGPSSQEVTAAQGGTLCVFTFTMTVPLNIDESLYGPQVGYDDPPTVTVSAGADHSIPVQLQQSGAVNDWALWDTTVAVSVPKGADPILAVSFNRFTQRFDLKAGRRLAPDPLGLYRSTGRFPYLTDTPSVTGTLIQHGPGKEEVVDVPFSVTDAYLTYFPPDGVTTLPPSGETYLAVEPSIAPPQSDEQYLPDSMPASILTLRLPDGHDVAGQVAPDPNFGQDEDWFANAVYYFPVPATFTTGTLIAHAVAPLKGIGTSGTGNSGASGTSGTSGTGVSGNSGAYDYLNPPAATVTLTGTVEIPITFAATHLATASEPGEEGNSFPVVPTLGVGLPVVAAGGVLLGLRRLLTHAVPARPVTRPLSYALAAAHTTVSRGGTDVIFGVVPAGRTRPDLPPEVPVGSSTAPDNLLPPPPTVPPPVAATEVPALVVGVLGPLDVQGLTASLRRRPAQRLMIYLAVSIGRPLSSDQLRHALATSEDDEPSAESLRRYASDLRQALPAGLLPSAGEAGGYQLTGAVQVDWIIFQSLVAQARRLPAGPDRIAPLRQAIDLVRGVPLAGASWDGIDPLARHIEATVEQVAAETAVLALELRQPQMAEELVTGGLRAVPYSPQLWDLRLRAAAAGSGLGLDRAWQQAQERLGSDSAPLAVTYQQLRTQPS